jgi:hypothetical protein
MLHGEKLISYVRSQKHQNRSKPIFIIFLAIFSRFHSGSCGDSYSSYNDADPRGLRVENLLGSLKQLNVNYFFGKINNSTNVMINEFRKVMKDDDFVREVDMANPGNIFSAAVHSVAMTIDTRIAATLCGG